MLDRKCIDQNSGGIKGLGGGSCRLSFSCFRYSFMFIYALTRETNTVFFHSTEMRHRVCLCICGSFSFAVFSAPSISGGATSFPTPSLLQRKHQSYVTWQLDPYRRVRDLARGPDGNLHRVIWKGGGRWNKRVDHPERRKGQSRGGRGI